MLASGDFNPFRSIQPDANTHTGMNSPGPDNPADKKTAAAETLPPDSADRFPQSC